MDLKAFELIVNTEDKARRYLRKFCWKNGLFIWKSSIAPALGASQAPAV